MTFLQLFEAIAISGVLRVTLIIQVRGGMCVERSSFYCSCAAKIVEAAHFCTYFDM